MKPTWSDWPEVIEAQNEDVTSHSPCLYIGRWDGDSRNWVPEVSSTGITWDICSTVVQADAEFYMHNRITSDNGDLWNPVGEERTRWYPVQYPH